MVAQVTRRRHPSAMADPREPEGGWWQDEKGKWRRGDRPASPTVAPDTADRAERDLAPPLPAGGWWQDMSGKWRRGGPPPDATVPEAETPDAAGVPPERAPVSSRAAPDPREDEVAPSRGLPRVDEEAGGVRAFEKLHRRVKQSLENNLDPGERIRVIIRGVSGQAMVGTDTRVFVCKPGFMAGASFGAEVTSWSYLNLVGVQRHKGLASGSVLLQAPAQGGTKTSYWGKGDADPFKAPNAIPVAGDWKAVDAGVARLRALIEARLERTLPQQAVQQPSVQQQPLSIADELRKLAELQAEGTLTPEEFAAAKARLIEG